MVDRRADTATGCGCRLMRRLRWSSGKQAFGRHRWFIGIGWTENMYADAFCKICICSRLCDISSSGL